MNHITMVNKGPLGSAPSPGDHIKSLPVHLQIYTLVAKVTITYHES